MKDSLDSPLKALACDSCKTLPFTNDETGNAIEMKDAENANGQGKLQYGGENDVEGIKGFEI